MDRTVYNSATSWGGYSEQSDNAANFQALIKSGQVLPERPYRWLRWDGKSPYGPTYNGMSTDRQAHTHQIFTDSCTLGYCQESAGSVRSSRFHNVDTMHQIVRNKLSLKARDFPIDLGVSLGEYRETAEFVASAMQKSGKLFRDIKKFKFSDALKGLTGRRNDKLSDVAKASADAWLGYSYAVRPIMSDVYGAVDVLTKDPSFYKPLKAIRVRQSQSVDAYAEYTQPGSRYWHRQLGRMRATAKLEFYVENPLLFTLDQLGVVNPLALGWELIPFSFVVDWFIPIGEQLRGVVPPSGVEFLRGHSYVKCEGVTESATTLSSPPFTPPGWNTKATSKSKLKDRRVLSSFPTYKLVRPDLSLSYSQLMSGASLLTGLMKDFDTEFNLGDIPRWSHLSQYADRAARRSRY